PIVANPGLADWAKGKSKDAMRGALFTVAGVFPPEAFPAGADTPPDETIWRLTVEQLNNGAAAVEDGCRKGVDHSCLIYALGLGAASLIESRAKELGLPLFGRFFAQSKRDVFRQILVFHASFGLTIGLCVSAIMRDAYE